MFSDGLASLTSSHSMQILEPLTFLFISLLKLIRKCKNGAFSRKKQLKNHKPTEIPSSGRKKKINMPKK